MERQYTSTTQTVRDGDGAPFALDANRNLKVVTVGSGSSSPSASSATTSSLASSATSAQLLAANADRKGLLVTNTDANDLYLKYGTTASATSFAVKIPSGGYWEMPEPIYTGRIDAIWAADGAGAAQYTVL